MSKTAVVVPCYNEAKRLPVAEYELFLETHQIDFQFIFVNDGSTDQTLSVLNDLMKKYPLNVSVLDLKQNQGKAEAVRLGMQQALANPEFNFVGFWDADLATPLAALLDFTKVMEKSSQTQIVTGARCKLLGRSVKRKNSRHYLGRVFATVVSVTLHLGVYDTQCGAKLFRSNETVKSLFSERFSSKWIFDVEIIARFIKERGLQVVESSIFEFPLFKWQHIEGSKVKMTDFFKAFFELIGIYNRYLKDL